MPEALQIAILIALSILALVLLVPITNYSVYGFNRDVPRDENGNYHPKPTIFIQACGGFSLLLALAVLAAIPFLATKIELLAGDLMMGVALLIAAYGFGFSAYQSLVLKIRFNEQGFEWKGFGQARFWPWEEVERIDHNFMYGAAVVRKGRIKHVPKVFRGFRQLITMAASKGVLIHSYIRLEFEGEAGK